MSIKVKVYNQKAEAVKDKNLDEKVFGMEVNESLVHQAMVAQSSNERQVLAHTKSRAEVRGGGRKPWRQKGTGRARVGSNRSPIWIGGGITFGPTKERNFKKDINRKMKRSAISMVLSDFVKNDNLMIVEDLKIENFKTKEALEVIKNFEKITNKKEEKQPKRSFLVVNEEKDDKAKYSLRNLEGVKYINLENINILDLLKYNVLIISEKSVDSIQEIYTK
ncbi:50S ribosomal protein L4 [Candidatus Parcubacteria bacterium]|nr:MAG: 50S ribosomal protein L4 [Candidatus Parcubacteria bacterium]